MDEFDFEFNDGDEVSSDSNKKNDKKKDKKSNKKIDDKKNHKKDKKKDKKHKEKLDKKSDVGNEQVTSDELDITQDTDVNKTSNDDFKIQDIDSKVKETSFEEDTDFEMEEDAFEIIEEDQEYLRKKSIDTTKKMIRLVIVGLILMIACSLGCYTFIIKRAELDKFDSALHEGQYDSAAKIYQNLMDSQLSQADIMIVEKANKIYEKYSKSAIKSDKAVEEINKLQKISENDLKELQDMLKLYKRIIVSEEHFEKAIKAYEEMNYVEAITYFKKVIKEDSHFNTAQNQLKKVVGDYRKIRVEEAEKHAENEEYDKAITVMLDTLKVLGDDEQTNKQLQTYRSAKLSLEISDIMDTVDVYSKKKEYVNAIKVVKKAITTYGEDVRLLDMMSSLVDSMYKEVNKYIESKRYTVAVTMLKSYVRIVPDDSKAAELISKYASNVERGTYLSKLKWTSSEGKSYKIEDVANYTDAEGNKYESVIELAGYKNLDKTGSIVFDATNYKTLTGMIGYVNGEQISYYKEGKGIVRIYGDNKQIFKSEVLSEDGKTHEIDLDISAYKQIKITWSSADTKNIKTYGIVLGDVSVK